MSPEPGQAAALVRLMITRAEQALEAEEERQPFLVVTIDPEVAAGPTGPYENLDVALTAAGPFPTRAAATAQAFTMAEALNACSDGPPFLCIPIPLYDPDPTRSPR